MSPSTAPAIVITDLHTRRLLLHAPSISSVPPANPTFDRNAIMILTIILGTLVISLLLNTIVKCAIRYSNRTQLDTEDDAAARHNSSMRRKALRTLSSITYSDELKLQGVSGGECAICISEFVCGDKIRVLPECNHGFHIQCVDRWLLARPSCPTCRRSLFSSSLKVSPCTEASRPGVAQSVIVPLEPQRILSP